MKDTPLFSLLAFTLGLLLLMTLPSFLAEEESPTTAHDHVEYPRPHPSDLKPPATTTICGDTAVVFNSGRHVDIPQRHMHLLVDKPK